MTDMADWLRKLIGNAGEPVAGATRGKPAVGVAPSRQEPPPPQAPVAKPSQEGEAPQIWQVGDVILDLYEVTSILGEGGMGTVYKVHHKGWSVDLAVKCPKPAQLARAGGVENFVRECETWVNLGLHPHTVSCYYVRNLGGIPRVFAEYVEGGSLADWIHDRRLYEGGPEQALKRILDIAIQFAWGLHYAHEQGLIHQDVKPANVMLTSGGLVKVTDFGLAKARAMGPQTDVPAAGQSILVASGGMTPAYCSPEQASGQALSRKTDIWSLGLSVLEMFTGEVSWMGGQVAAEALQDYTDMGAGDDTLPKMPQALAALLNRCFAADPQNRPQTGYEVAGKLIEIYQNATQEVYPRQEPKAADLGADSLNNRALSLLDLGKTEQAQGAWQQALAADPQHLESTYNRGLQLWRQAKITDQSLLDRFDNMRRDAKRGGLQVDTLRVKYLQALIHIERGDLDTAIRMFQRMEGTHEWRKLNEYEINIRWEQLDKSQKFAQSKKINSSGRLRELKQKAKSKSVCLSIDARFALSGEDKTVRLWDVATGMCLQSFEGHTDCVALVGLSADATLAFSSSNDKTVRVWDVVSGRCVRNFVPGDNSEKCMALGSNGNSVLALYHDGKTLRLWDVAQGQFLRNLLPQFSGKTKSHEFVQMTQVFFARLSAGARFALVHFRGVMTDAKLGVWSVSTGQCLQIFEGTHYHYIGASACFSADSRLILSLDRKSLRLWDVATGQCLSSTNVGDGTGSLSADCFCANTGMAITTSGRLLDIFTGRCLYSFAFAANDVCISSDGRLILSALHPNLYLFQVADRGRSSQAPLQLSRVRSFQEVAASNAETDKWVKLAYGAIERGHFAEALGHLRKGRSMPDGERSPHMLEAWGSLSMFCRRTGLRGLWEIPLEGETQAISSSCVSANARFALSGGRKGLLQLWDLTTGRCLHSINEGFDKPVWAVSLSADSRFGFSATHHGVSHWDLVAWRKIGGFRWDGIRCMSISSDARFGVVGTDSGICLWDVASGQPLRSLVGHKGSVTSVELSPDSTLLLSKGLGDVRLWDVATGVCMRVFQDHSANQRSLRLSLDGRHFVLSSDENLVSIWDVKSEQCLGTFEADAFCHLSPDGRFLVSVGQGGLRVWDASLGQLLVTKHDQELSAGPVADMVLSADGRAVLTGGHNSKLQAWHLDWELEAVEAADWQEGVRRYLENFLNCQMPYTSEVPRGRNDVESLVKHAINDLSMPFVVNLPKDYEPIKQGTQLSLSRRGKPSWDEEDFKRLLETLGRVGYGWVRPEGVRAELDRMAQDWTEPPLLPTLNTSS